MDAIDNPSYFSLPTDAPKKIRNFISLRKWSDPTKSSATLPVKEKALSNDAQSRRNFRSLTRAASNEETNLLMMGKPRPSDLAPSVYNNLRQRHSSIGDVNSNDLLHQDMVHCDPGDNDVFVSANRNVQYNNTATLPMNRTLTPGRRRHSVGSFLNRDRAFVTVTDGETRTKDRDASMRKKFKKTNKGGSKMVEDDLDILLVSCGESEAATLWINYLISCFQQSSRERKKPPFKLQNIKLEDTLCPQAPSFSFVERYANAKLQIVVICPYFLQKIQMTSTNENLLTKILHSEKILAMLLGVQNNMMCRMKNVFANYDQWRFMNVKDLDKTCVGDFLGVSMDILSRSRQIQEIMNSEHEETGFSVLPKKVKVGQNKLFLFFTEPLSTDDTVKVSVCKNTQRIEILSVKKRNPYTLQFTMPACCLQISMLVGVQIEKNGKLMGKRMVKCESKLREMEQLLLSVDNPLQFLCQSIGFNAEDKDHLDTFLLNNYLKNTPANFSVLSPNMFIDRNLVCNEEYPTLLHFAAKQGFEKLSWQLIESPGGEQACQIRNSSHLTPADMAEKANHLKLSNFIKSYMKMTELSSAYNYLKGISEKERQLAEYNYLLPKPLSDTYLIPPAARPVDPSATFLFTDTNISSSFPFYTNFKPCNFTVKNATSPTSSTASASFLENYDVPLNGRPYTPPTPQSPVQNKMDNYLDMNSAGHDRSHFGSTSSFNTNTGDFSEHGGDSSRSGVCERESLYSNNNTPFKYGSANHLSHKEKLSAEDELLEIINDFKNNVFTIGEVEALVENWQKRNDVQQSFREKQEQLNKMREEYDRIQRRMKEQLKRTTPLERILRFFGRGKSKHSGSNEGVCVNSDVSGYHMQRASSLSLHSSSSGSSGVNSVSSGNYSAVDGTVTKQQHLKSSSNEKLNKIKINPCADVSQLPKYSDLNEYVQPDCLTCNFNHRQSCCGSVLNETIHEGNEVDSLEYSSDASSILLNRVQYQLNSAKKNSKSKYETSSLRTETKRNYKNVGRNKVKSAENLLCGREYINVETGNSSDSVTEYPRDQLSELSACATLCAETLKCLSDLNVPQNGESTSEITFIFDKPNVNTSDCDSPVISRKSSSLDLSSLSLISNCTIDENCEIKEEKCSLELKITEEVETETETAPPVSLECASKFVDVCELPEYVNVKIENQPPLTGPCKCTVVS